MFSVTMLCIMSSIFIFVQTIVQLKKVKKLGKAIYYGKHRIKILVYISIYNITILAVFSFLKLDHMTFKITILLCFLFVFALRLFNDFRKNTIYQKGIEIPAGIIKWEDMIGYKWIEANPTRLSLQFYSGFKKSKVKDNFIFTIHHDREIIQSVLSNNNMEVI